MHDDKEIHYKTRDSKTQQHNTSLSFTAPMHWSHSLIASLSIITIMIIQEITHFSVKPSIMMMVVILSRDHMIYPRNYG